MDYNFKDFYGKFRVKFLPFDSQSAEDNCLTCVNMLKKYFKINEMDNQVLNNSIVDSQLSQLTTSSNKVNTSDNIGSQFEKLSLSNNKETFTQKDMALVIYIN
jgi:hypothetical protein